MNIGMVGLGKLGLPVAVSIAERGHTVMGFDLRKERMSKETQPYQEAGPNGQGDFNKNLQMAENLSFGSLQEVVNHADILFVAVQTPHDPRYEGTTPIPVKRIDFDYRWLCEAVKEITACVTKPTILSIISTCLPGTMREHILPRLANNENISLVYNPFFIAMGTTMFDFTHPEFILMGTERQGTPAVTTMCKFYESIVGAGIPLRIMSLESAELTKVAYNCFIGQKIIFANTIMEICHKIPNADCGDVSRALKEANRRLISGAYLNGGMGDGGGCHPRDSIAMSSLAQRLDLSYDLFESVMYCREDQAKWKANLVRDMYIKTKLPILLLGYAFKPGTNLTVGSPALLVYHFLTDEMGLVVKKHDHHVRGTGVLPENTPPSLILLGCKHEEYQWASFPKGSIVIDPFRMVRQLSSVEVIHLGKGK